MLKIGGQTVPNKTLLLVMFDSIAISLALLGAMCVRFYQQNWHVSVDLTTVGRLALVVLICEISLYFNDLYVFEMVRRRSELVVRLVRSLGVSCVIVAILYYLSPNLELGRGVTLYAAPLIALLVLSWRLTASDRLLMERTKKVLVVGTGQTGVSLVREIIGHPEFNLNVVGFLDEKGENIGKSLVNPGIIGGVGELEDIVAREKIDEVVLSLAERRGTTPGRSLLHLKFGGVHIDDAHSFHERLMGKIVLENLSPSWLILSDGFRKSPFLLAAKRLIDLVCAIAILCVVWPVMLAVAVAVWLESGRPLLFHQTRVGQGGRHFEVLKFRSMRQDAEEDGPRWAADGDDRITRVGKFIRKFRLDEFPQLVNVIRGEMSLVGPRPERPEFTEMLEREIPFYGLRHTVTPGVTGWAQIKWPYGSTTEDAKRKLELDLFYIKHLAIPLDLAIIFETAKVVLFGRGSR